MLIKPLKRFTPRPVALVFPGWHTLIICTAAGERKVSGATNCYNALKELERFQIYAPRGLRGLLYTTGSKCWQAEIWRGRATSLTLDGTHTRITSLRGVFDDLGSPLEMFSALSECLIWLENYGVSPGSISSMSWNLWRSTLTEPLEMAFDGKVARSAFYGGRQESAAPKTYQGMVSVDIASAYPFSMASRPYAATLREVATSTNLDPTRAGMARATVYVDADMPYPPLPLRVAEEMIMFSRGVVSGCWTWGELAAAKELGCRVDIQRCWAPSREVDPFSDWWAVVRDGRAEVSPSAVKLVKAISNSLWGMFGMTGDDRATVRWHDDGAEQPEYVKRAARKMPQANTAHIAAETTSRVRVRMLREGLYGDYTGPIHVDTDGMIVRKTSLPRRALGTGPGQWQVKAMMPRVELRGPQLYRYRCGSKCGLDHANWHYVAAGMGLKAAEEFFSRDSNPIRVSIGSPDTVLPAGNAQDLGSVTEWQNEAYWLKQALYGPPLVASND